MSGQKKMKLTKAEEEIMHLLWTHGPQTVSHLMQYFEEPKPAQTTISSFVRILEKKGFVDHKAYGRTFEYYPIISKAEYSKSSIKELVSNYFGGSVTELVSFLAKEEDLSISEITKLIDQIEKK